MTFFLSYRIGIKSATAFLKKEVCMNNAIAKRQNDLPSVTFGNVVDNIFQNSLRRFFDDNFWDVEGQLTTGSVPVNVREMDHQYEIDVIAPGCKRTISTLVSATTCSLFPLTPKATITVLKKQAGFAMSMFSGPSADHSPWMIQWM